MDTKIPHSLIIHITEGDSFELKEQLDQNEDYKKYYDGWEATMIKEEVVSRRLYYYGIPVTKLLNMLRHLRTEGVGYKYRIRISDKNDGNCNFD